MDPVVLNLSRQTDEEQVAELQRVFGLEVRNQNLIMDLKEVTLVDRDAVIFLARRDGAGTRLRNCPDTSANRLCNEPEFADPDPHDSPRLPSGQDVWSVKGAMFALYKTVSDQGRLEFDVAPIAPGGMRPMVFFTPSVGLGRGSKHRTNGSRKIRIIRVLSPIGN